MALIKNAHSDRLVKDAIVLDMGDLARQADRILTSARAQATAILDEARAEAAHMRSSADGRGYAEGLERGVAEGRQRGQDEGRGAAFEQWTKTLQQITESWLAALKQWEADRASMLHEARVDIIRFAFAVARQVVRRLIEVDPTIAGDQIGEALGLVKNLSSVEVRINPNDRAVAEVALAKVLAGLESCAHASLRDDASIARGGCIVATGTSGSKGGRGSGTIDATIETQLVRIAEAIVPAATSCKSLATKSA